MDHRTWPSRMGQVGRPRAIPSSGGNSGTASGDSRSTELGRVAREIQLFPLRTDGVSIFRCPRVYSALALFNFFMLYNSPTLKPIGLLMEIIHGNHRPIYCERSKKSGTHTFFCCIRIGP
jgi:hypothetical protein